MSHDGFEPSTLTLKEGLAACGVTSEKQSEIEENSLEKIVQNSLKVSEKISMIPQPAVGSCVSNVSRPDELVESSPQNVDEFNSDKGEHSMEPT